MGHHEIEPNVVYWDWAEYEHKFQEVGDQLEWRTEKRKRKQIKFLLLPKAIETGAYRQAETFLQAADRRGVFKTGSRAANGQKYGTKVTLGWMKLRYPGYDNMRTAPTCDNPELLAGLYPLFTNMDSLLQEAVPEYYNYAWNWAMRAERPQLRGEDGRFVDEDNLDRQAVAHGKAVVHALDPWDMTYTIRGTVFSSAELNRNIVFKAHEDKHNVDGTCVCITTLGDFVGGRLVFPRYGYSAELGPRDLLLCDNNHELHGNLGPIVGERFSVVAFLHDSVYGTGADAAASVPTGG